MKPARDSFDDGMDGFRLGNLSLQLAILVEQEHPLPAAERDISPFRLARTVHRSEEHTSELQSPQ